MKTNFECYQSDGLDSTHVDEVYNIFQNSLLILWSLITICTLQGHLNTYRFCDNVWTFVLERVEFREVGEVVKADKVKVVACDGKGLLECVCFSCPFTCLLLYVYQSCPWVHKSRVLQA